MKKYCRYLCRATGMVLFLLALISCTKSVEIEDSSENVTSQTLLSESLNNQSTVLSDSVDAVLTPLPALDQLSEMDKHALKNAINDVAHLSFDTAHDDANKLIYQGILAPGTSSFWNFHSTGDSEEDYRLHVVEGGGDPLQMFQTYGKFKAKDVDWILENIYNMQPTHQTQSYESEMYYYDGFYYVRWMDLGYEPNEIRLIALNPLGDNVYEVQYEVYDAIDSSYLISSGMMTLKRKLIDGEEHWTYLKSEMQYEGEMGEADNFTLAQ